MEVMPKATEKIRLKPRVRLKALVIQGGEIPPPVKPNQQPVLSLGVEAVRSDLSVDNDNDPQIPCQHHSQAVTVALSQSGNSY